MSEDTNLDASLQTEPLVQYDNAVEIQDPPPPPPIRKCSFIALAGPVLARMAQMYPQSPVTRANIMALFGEMPPAEMDTYEKLVDWVEFKFTKTLRVVNPPVPVPRPARNRNVALAVEVSESETETGSCRYTVSRNRSSSVEFTHDELMEYAADHDDFDDVVNAVQENAMENADGDWEDDDDYEYSRHEGIDCDNHNTDVRAFRERLAAYLRQHLSAERLEELGL